jgi:sugar phosphate isomerase/epimerase
MPDAITRRRFLHTAAAAVLAASNLPAAAGKRKFTLDLACGAIGVKTDLPDAIALAHQYGFESVGADAGYLGKLSDGQVQELLADLKKKNLVWGAAGLPVDFRTDGARFEEGMKALPTAAGALQRAGVTRVGTWLRPSHDSLTYLANFKQHGQRLRQVAQVLGDHGLRFGLEYVSPRTSWTAAQHSFVHSLAEAKELIAEIGRPNVGLVLDSWHWYNAGETAADLLTLTNKDVVACDLNDAPAGIPREKQMDNTRELPAATGVIDVKAFLGALVQIGYDGPVRAEPFNAALRKLPKEEAVAATAKAMKQAFGLLE